MFLKAGLACVAIASIYAIVYTETEELTDAERIIAILSTEGPKSVKELQEALNYNNRGHFLKNVLNPMLEEGVVYRDGKPKSPYAQIIIN